MTSTLTLTRDPQSMLAAMFSGRHALHKDDDGAYFIDRDATQFRYVLNYLRDGGFRAGTLPADQCFLSELCTEAEYYQLPGLTRLVTDQITALQAATCRPAGVHAGDDLHAAASGGSLSASPSTSGLVGSSPAGRRLQRKVSAQQTIK